MIKRYCFYVAVPFLITQSLRPGNITALLHHGSGNE